MSIEYRDVLQPKRLHSTLGYKSKMQFLRGWLIAQLQEKAGKMKPFSSNLLDLRKTEGRSSFSLAPTRCGPRLTSSRIAIEIIELPKFATSETARVSNFSA
jgi:hypothetical protein